MTFGGRAVRQVSRALRLAGEPAVPTAGGGLGRVGDGHLRRGPGQCRRGIRPGGGPVIKDSSFPLLRPAQDAVPVGLRLLLPGLRLAASELRLLPPRPPLPGAERLPPPRRGHRLRQRVPLVLYARRPPRPPRQPLAITIGFYTKPLCVLHISTTTTAKQSRRITEYIREKERLFFFYFARPNFCYSLSWKRTG